MARSMRTRKPAAKYPEEDYLIDTKSKTSRINKLDVVVEETKFANLPVEADIVESAIVKGSKTRLTKGNLNAGWRTVTAIQTTVLRDRTNLPGEPLKVDLLLKQGTGGGVTKKPAISTRRMAYSRITRENEDENAKKTSSTRGTRKNSRKVEDTKESSSVADEELPGVDLSIKQGTNDGVAKKKAKSIRTTTKSATAEENNDEIVKKTSSSRKTRKNAMKVEAEKESSSNEGEEPAKVDLLIKQRAGVGVAKRTSKSTRITAKSATTADDTHENTKKTSSAKVTRKKSEKIDVDEKSSSDGVSKDTADKRVDSGAGESPTVDILIKRGTNDGVAKKPARSTRRTAKTTSLVKNDDDHATMTSSAKVTRKKSQKVITVSETSSGTKIQNKKSIESGIKTPSDETTKKLEKRAASKRTPLPKQSDDSDDSAKKSSRRPSRVKDNEETDVASVIVKNKFFKSKVKQTVVQGISPVKKTVTAKRRNIGTRQKVRMSTSFRSRQTTLSESFAKQTARKFLRPRREAKNYCEDSAITKAGASRNDDKNVKSEKFGPIYKSVKLQDNSLNDKCEIYEFQFDSNDSNEKLRKKARKRIVKRNIVKKKSKATGSSTKKMTNSETRAIEKAAITKIPTGTEKNVKPEVVERITIETRKPNEFEAATSSPMEIDQVPVTPENPSVLPIIHEEQSKNVATQVSKPIVVKSVELKGNERINLTATPILQKSSEAKRKSSLRTSLQYRTMLNHALLNKSLSPITKAIESFDPGSPWRPPTFVNQQFSRVKNVVQSTPQVRKFATMLEKTGTLVTTESARSPRMKKILRKSDENVNVSEVLNNESPKKALELAKSPRKFGTEISNVDKGGTIGARIIDENKNDSEENRMSLRKPASIAIEKRVANTNYNVISNRQVETMKSFNDDADDKENCASSPSSPKKSPLKRLNISPLKSLNKSPFKTLNKSPLMSLNRSPHAIPTKLLSTVNPPRALNKLSTVADENVEPQPGTSSSKNPGPSDNSRILRQSNLHNFLNVDEIPMSTRISTIHGIFDDAHSTPIHGKPMKKMIKDPNLANAFGFDDIDDSNLDFSPIKKSYADDRLPKGTLTREENRQGKTIASIPARLSIGDIKMHLLPMKKKSKVIEGPIVERIEEEETEERASTEEKAAGKNKKIDDPVHLSDPFDQLTEKVESDGTSTKEIPLFADLQPAHFKEAPRYSYKRKRAVGFIFSEDEEDNENLPGAKSRDPKKRKISKVERERQMQMEHWAKGLNETFEEIDHFDLVVE